MFNMKDPTTFKSEPAGTTLTNLISTKYQGVSGGGTAEIKDNFSMTANGVRAVKSNCMFGAWVKTANITPGRFIMGYDVTTTANMRLSRRWNTTPNAVVQTLSPPVITGTPDYYTGNIVVNRHPSFNNKFRYINNLWDASNYESGELDPANPNGIVWSVIG